MHKSLFDIPKFPGTRYQGSKLKFIDWIWDCIKDLKFNTALDAFGGTGAVAYHLKLKDKIVTYNDILKFNQTISRAIIENNEFVLDDDDLGMLLDNIEDAHSSGLISRHFSGIYYTDEENLWLDRMRTRIESIENPYKRSIAYFALFQSCIIKRPYNLFHRKNLYLRLQDVERSFGNKKTWDTSFEHHFCNFVREANRAVFDNGKKCRSLCSDVFDLDEYFDLVYIDPPYISGNGIGVDYHHFYHFLEGIADYEHWEEKIDFRSKHRRLSGRDSQWQRPEQIENAFRKLFEKFKDSILLVSYRSDGIPKIDTILRLLSEIGKKTKVHTCENVKYVLSKKTSAEVLIVAR